MFLLFLITRRYTCIILFLFFLVGCTWYSTPQACLKDKCYQVEIANTPELRAQGLMWWSDMCENCGMIFIFPDEQVRSFWMKNTLMSLDILFFDANRRLIDWVESLPPETSENIPQYTSIRPAKYVLEIQSGQIKYHDFHEWDILTIKFD